MTSQNSAVEVFLKHIVLALDCPNRNTITDFSKSSTYYLNSTITFDVLSKGHAVGISVYSSKLQYGMLMTTFHKMTS